MKYDLLPVIALIEFDRSHPTPGEGLLGDCKEGRTGGSLAQFTSPKNRGSWFTDIKNSFSRITKIRKLDTL